VQYQEGEAQYVQEGDYADGEVIQDEDGNALNTQQVELTEEQLISNVEDVV